MPLETKLYRVLIASPGDVEKERAIVREEIARWNSMHAEHTQMILLPIGWETDATPDLSDRGQAIINNQLVDKCDLLIGIFWTRIGTPTPEAESGTVEEIQRFIAQGKRCIVYFSDRSAPPSKIDSQQYKRLRNYRQKLNKIGLTDAYKEIEEFREKVNRHIVKSIQAISTNESVEKILTEKIEITTGEIIEGSTQSFVENTKYQLLLRTLPDAENTIRQLLVSPFGIQDMKDLGERGISEVKSALKSSDLATFFHYPQVESIPTVTQLIEKIATPSILALTSITKYGDDTTLELLELVGDWVESLSTREIENNSYQWVNYVKIYPGLLAFYTVGISALQSGKFGFLKEVVERHIYSTESGKEISLINMIDPRYVFYGEIRKLIEPGFENRHTPVSDHIATFVRDLLYPNIDKLKYLNYFDLFEILISLKCIQLNENNTYPYFGSYIWRTDTRRFIVKSFQEAALRQGSVGIGISNLFNGTAEFEKLSLKYDAIVKNINWDYGHYTIPFDLGNIIKVTRINKKVKSYEDIRNSLQI
jgi:Domain of unknown function (DUF4062)